MCAILRKEFGCVWVNILRSLSGIILVHVATLADIVTTLGGNVRAGNWLFAQDSGQNLLWVDTILLPLVHNLLSCVCLLIMHICVNACAHLTIS